MIEQGRVAINGVPISTPATVLTTLAGVTVDDAPVGAAEPTRLYIFHKPPGYLTAAFDPKGRPTIYDRLPKDLPRVMPVGRLDLNTEGLLLLTTDGEFKRQLELPATGVERSYRARAYGQVSQAQLEDLIEGVEIEGVRYGQIDANLERRTGANVWIEMTLREGKNREVRRVLEYLGLEVSRLIRTRYGPFILGDLPPGEVGEVRQNDLVTVRKTLKLPVAQRAEDGGTVTAAPIKKRAAPPISLKPGVEPERRARAPRPVAVRKPEVREEIDTRPQRPTARPTSRPQREIAPAAEPQRGRSGRQRTDAAPAANRPLRNAAPARPPRPERSAPVRPPREAGSASVAVRAPRDTAPRTIGPRPPGTAAQADETPRPPKPKKGAGWARAKPKAKPGAKPSKRT